MTPNKFLKGMVGIYGIRNTVNGKIYVGKTKDMHRRSLRYYNNFKKRQIGQINDYLFNAVSKIGMENFEFFPLQFCKLDELADLELKWMIKLRSIESNFGYNLRMDSSTSMIVHPNTSDKISKNLKRQWESGVRDDHGDKLSKNWRNNLQRKKDQSRLFSKLKTKYEYTIYHPDGFIENCMFDRLKELGIHNVISNFYRQDSNDVMCKGYRVVRYSLGERE